MQVEGEACFDQIVMWFHYKEKADGISTSDYYYSFSSNQTLTTPSSPPPKKKCTTSWNDVSYQVSVEQKLFCG